MPEIEIEGTKFLFDIDRIALIEKDNPQNHIYFDGMRDHDTHYSFEYSTVSKNYPFVRTASTLDELFDGILEPPTVPDAPIHVEIPRIGDIDPDGMCRKYGCTLQDIEHKSDFEIMVNQEAYNKRMDGEPVTIDLAGKRFEVDVANNLLRPQDGGEVVFLNEFHYDYYMEDDEAYHLFYNISEGKVADPLSDGSRDRTEDRIILEVPNLSMLDPIGANLALGANPLYGLMYYDLKMNHVPKVVPWEEYGIGVDNQMERKLPTYRIEDTDFIVDVSKLELREKGNETNVIRFEDMRDIGRGYVFEYDLQEKNVPSAWSDNETTTVRVPEFVELDPVGMAQKYNMPSDEIKGKTDFDIMVDQEAFDMRVNKGILPTIDIAGHTFYVDIRMDMLRPKDDFLSNGIVFSDIENFFDEERQLYFIPYHAKTHEFREIDYETITKIPKDLIVVSFPNEMALDPVGWNRHHGFELTDGLKEKGLKAHFTAQAASWEDIYVPQIIKENLDKLQREAKKEKPEKDIAKPPEKKQRKGRKM